MLSRSLALLAFAPSALSKRVRIVSYNIHAWRDADHADNLERLSQLLAGLAPDVVCLNEVLDPFAAPAPDDPYWSEVRERRGYGRECPPGSRPTDERATHLSRLSAALGLPHRTFGAANEGGFFGRFPFGNCILSRYELADVRHAILRVTDADLTLGGQSRTTADLEDRGATTARVQIPGVAGGLGIAVTHLDHKAEELRERQISEAIAHCKAAFGDDPHLLMGDLNSFSRADLDDEGWAAICALYASKGWPPPREESLVQRALRDAGFADAYALQAARAAPTPPPTCWTATRLDYMMLSRRARETLRVQSLTTLEWDASDHKPLVCDLEI